jgi:transglutaminase-like putative cysteine protease
VADLTRFRGIGQFGPAYRYMYERDVHAPGSVERVLLDRMIRLCDETAADLYVEPAPVTAWATGSRPELERYLAAATADCVTDEERIAGVVRFCASLAASVPDDLEAMRWGGTEEEIIRRGSDWCNDLARVAVALCQVAGLPARIVFLANTSQAYSGHVIAEVYRAGRWGAVDPTNGIVYRHPDGAPASTWELMNDPSLILTHWPGEPSPDDRTGLYRAAAIADYDIRDATQYDYKISGINAYYRSILEQADRGWTGGLRWLHGEDRSE